jgi:hypothetical protein
MNELKMNKARQREWTRGFKKGSQSSGEFLKKLNQTGKVLSDSAFSI